MKRLVLGGVFVNLALLIIGLTWIVPAARPAKASEGPARPTAPAAVAQSTYVPQVKSFIVTTVPLLVHEQDTTFGYLTKDFSKKGVLHGKEVWGFSPSSLTVYQGDTVNLTLVDPSGDPHTFTIPDLGYNLNVDAEATATGSFEASKVGIFSFACEVGEHSPYMWGQLVVLPDSDAPQA
ncbi:MAG: cupredoxin domain-containing protein [Actinobacteria bacterium]|nr:cupredoxin domain-containing protein [Actinomycetota bacterium]